jgi:3-hydroxyacyl-[acyl-carrier-protein] dehydratase
MQMDIKEILRYLPHRYPFLLIDRVTDATAGDFIRGYKNLSFNEPFFQGHFPAHAIMPGVLMIEGMAQLAGVLIFLTTDVVPGPEPKFVLAGVDDVRFKKMVVPGDRLDYEVKIIKCRNNLWKFACTASVDSQLVASANITNAGISSD